MLDISFLQTLWVYRYNKQDNRSNSPKVDILMKINGQIESVTLSSKRRYRSYMEYICSYKITVFNETEDQDYRANRVNH